MSVLPCFARAALRLAALLALTIVCCRAEATLTQQIDPPEVHVGDPVIITLLVQGGNIGGIQFPQVEGLQPAGTSFEIKTSGDNGNFTTSVALKVSVIPTHPGNFTIPGFNLHTQEGEILQVKPMKLHVLGNANPPPPTSVTTPGASTDSSTNAANPNAPVIVNGGGAAEVHSGGVKIVSPGQLPAQLQQALGPVVLPSTNAPVAPAAPGTTASGNPPDATAAGPNPPRDADGGPAKVFILITPQTTEAYVGEAVLLQIDFFIRLDVAYDQNSLPTIKGSNFLMNSFTTRGQQTQGALENQAYVRERWITAISAPKSGNFPLSMERDTYWVKSFSNTNVNTIFGGLFGRQANLAHEMVSSNQVIMHVQPLPEEGRPAHFTGAIGQFEVRGEASPSSVAVGEPVKLRYTVSGEGNFDYVRCPALPDNPGWKAYVPRSGTNYVDQSHTRAVKTFEQSVIPLRNGNVPLPAASFSYFDPSAKHYVTTPITLPDILVTGTPPPNSAASPDGGSAGVSTLVPPKMADFQPNRLELGALQMSLVPIYRHAWFWAVQAALVALPIMGGTLLLLRARFAPDAGFAARELRNRSVRQEEDAMAEAARRKDARAFFIAARHAVQLQLGSQWGVQPEALTLGEIRRRDAQLAERLAPFFAQVDEVIYSGQTSAGLDLAQWEQRVRTELLQPQPA